MTSFIQITSKLDILVGHSRQVLAGAMDKIVKLLNLTVIVCHLGGPFSVVFPKKEQTIIVMRLIKSEFMGLTTL